MFYLAFKSDIVTSLIEEDCLLEDCSLSFETLLIKKPSSLGSGITFSLDNITTTDVMFGLSSG